MNIKNIIKDLSYTGYTKEIIRHEAIRIIEEQDKEIEQLTKECIGMKDEIKDLCNKLSKLNNIVDELEKDIIKIYNQSYYANDNQIIEIYNRLKELKGETNE